MDRNKWSPMAVWVGRVTLLALAVVFILQTESEWMDQFLRTSGRRSVTGVAALSGDPSSSSSSSASSLLPFNPSSFPDPEPPVLHSVPALMSDVEHAFVRSEDGKFIAVDRYLIQTDRRKTVIGVLGDGLVPITFEKTADGKESIHTNITCSYDNVHDSPATLSLMRGDESYSEHYFNRGNQYKTPFSTNGDRFRTMIILCEKLHFNNKLSRHPPLVLKSPGGRFSLTIGSTFAKPFGKVITAKTVPEDRSKMKLIHCLNPVYGVRDPRWIIEYLEYHKSIGVDHVHIYNIDMHSKEVQDVLQAYHDDNFVTRHDWSEKASGGYTSKETYEHAKWAAQTDCALRSRGIYDYALFTDIDELVLGSLPGGSLTKALKLCSDAYVSQNKLGCSFNSNTVSSVYTKLDENEELELKDKLLLERYNRIEASPHCPSNCRCAGKNCIDRKFHKGRQKYIANVRDLRIPARPFWTHAIERDYEEMDKVMKVLPDDVMQVRHYQGHWYRNENLLGTMDEVEAPLPTALMDDVRNMNTKGIRALYKHATDVSTSSGIDWIETVERPAKYHKK